MTSSALAAWRHELQELAFRTLFRASAAVGDLEQRVVYRVYFGWIYRRHDPWGHASDAYELAKYERTIAVIHDRAERALEAGCGEGHFTAMLLSLGLARQVVGVDINATALARAQARCAPIGHA